MKTKKLLAALLSSAMVLGTMAVPVFAANVVVADQAGFIAAVEAGNYVSGTVELSSDLEFTKPIMVGGNFTLVGNGKTISSSATRTLRVAENNVTLTIANTKFDGGNKVERALQIDSKFTGVSMDLDNVTATGFTTYTVNICGGVQADITAKDSTFEGWGAFNAWGNGGTAKFDNCTFTGINNISYDPSGWNGFGTVVIEGDTTGATTEAATFWDVELNNCKITAKSTYGNVQSAFVFNNPSAHNVVKVTGDNTEIDCTGDNTELIPYLNNNNKLSIKAGTFKGVNADPQAFLADGYTETVYTDSYEVKPATTVETTVSTAGIAAPVTIKSAIDMSKGVNGTYEQVTAKAVDTSEYTGTRVFTVTSTYYDENGIQQQDFTQEVTLTDITDTVVTGGNILCGLIITGIPNGYTVTID